MAQFILLGTGAALSDEIREHTFMVVKGKASSIMIDCGGSPIARLHKAGIPLDSIEHLILTHHHPDHLYGLPIFLLDLWLARRTKTLHIYGLPETLRAARGVMHAFEWEEWFNFGFFPVEFHRLSKKTNHVSFESDEFKVSTAMTVHLLPTVATRIESKASGKAVVYTSDTEVCEPVVELACNVDTLFHEATTINTPTRGHSTAMEAGAQAQRANVNKLVLVHLPPHGNVKKLRDAAKRNFKRQVVVGKDFAKYEF